MEPEKAHKGVASREGGKVKHAPVFENVDIHMEKHSQHGDRLREGSKTSIIVKRKRIWIPGKERDND